MRGKEKKNAGQKVGEFRMNSLSSSFLIHLSSLLTELIATGFVTRGPNTAYNSNPAVTCEIQTIIKCASI